MPIETGGAAAAPTDTPAALPASLHMAVHGSLASAEARWRAAAPLMACTAFQSFDWVQAWYETLGERQGWKVCIAELRSGSPDGPTVLLMPLGWRREGVMRVMGFLGAELADYQAPLIDRDFARALSPGRAAMLWRGLIATLPAVDMVRLRRMPATLGDIPNPFATLPRAWPSETAHAAMLPADFEQFAATRDAKLFADTRRQLRRLSELGTVRTTLRVEDPAERARVMQALVEQKSYRWRSTGATDAFAEPGYREFFERLAGSQLQGVDSVVSALYLDERPIATHWGMQTPASFYWILPTHDAELARFSPGRLLLEAVLRDAIVQGLPVFDLTVGDEPFKLKWADRHLPVYEMEEAWSSLGKYVGYWRSTRRWARNVPALRNAVHKLRGLFSRR